MSGCIVNKAVTKLRILIYGAGIIGSLYAVKFAAAGHDVCVYARGGRLRELKQSGLRYLEKSEVRTVEVLVIDKLQDDDIYDFIFLTVRGDQVKAALQDLNQNDSPTIVTMVNTAENQKNWEMLCGKGRILPAFPGAGGGWKNGVLDAALTPRLIQPTTFGELSGKKTERSSKLAELFQSSRIPYQIVPDMHAWQISHLGMVVPLADAYYLTEYPKYVYRDHNTMKKTARDMRKNFRKIHRMGLLSPTKFHLIRLCPLWILTPILTSVFHSSFADVFMYPHAMKAPEEMKQLHEAFYQVVGS